MNNILAFFNSDDFMPHGHCFLWQPDILWLHVVADAGIAFAYYLIPLLLFILIRKRKDLPYKPLFSAFSAFILLCGTTHLLAIWVLWHPDYALEGIAKALTAVVSIATVFILWKVVPKALQFIDPELLNPTEKSSGLVAAIIQSSTDAIISKTLDGKITSWNPAAVKMFGYTAAEAIGQHISFLIPKDRIDEESYILAQLYDGKRIEHFETIRVDKNGKNINVSLAISPVRDASGKVIGASKVVRNVSAQQESAAQFKLLANLLPQLAWMADETGWIFWYNDRWYEFTGTTLKDMEGWGWQSVHDAEKLPSVMEKWQGSIATGQPFEMAFPLKGADGVFRQFLTRVNPIHDTNGKIIKWFGTNTDITDQYEAEARAIEAFRHEESERTKLLALIENAPDFIGMADLDGNLLYHNRAARRLVGLPEDCDLTKLKISDMHPQWASERIFKAAVPIVYEKGSWKGDSAVLHKDGHEIAVAQTLALYRDKSGNPVCMTTIMQDISDQKNYLLALEKLHNTITKNDLPFKDKIYSLLELGRQYLKMPNGIMSHISNDIYEAKYPLVSEGVISENAQFPLADTFCIHTFKAKAPIAFEHVAESTIREHACYKNFCMESYIGCPVFVDGLFYGAVSFSHLQPRTKIFSENEFAFLQLLAQWIGNEIDRDQSDTKLRESEQSLKLGWQGTGVGMWDWDVPTNNLIWSDRFNMLLGFEPNELPNRYEAWEDRLHNDDKETTVAAVKSYLSQLSPSYDIEYRLITKSGQWRWYHATGKAIWNNEGQPVRMVGSLDDITERKNAESQRQQLIDKLNDSNTELERFAYVASHDMQEPLRVITNISGLIIDEYENKLDETGKEYVNLVKNSSERMQAMVEDLLSYARVKNDETRFVAVDAELEIKHVLENLSAAIVERRATVTHDALPQFFGSPVQFMRLLQNLIGNGLKYQASDTIPKVHVSVKDENEYWCFSVKDNGIGINEEFVNHVFEPFKRLHTWDEYKGSGIGLAVCKQIVESHGGRIWADSKFGEGSTFYFTIAKDINKQMTKRDAA